MICTSVARIGLILVFAGLPLFSGAADSRGAEKTGPSQVAVQPQGPAAAEAAFDVVVYGGTPGGVTAAVAAAREGVTVVVLEQTRHLGGLNTSGLNNSEVAHMHEWTFSGISREFYQRLAKAYGQKGLMHRWESKVAQKVFDQMVADAKVRVLYEQRLARVEKDGPRIRRLLLADGTSVAGRTFIDASYEGDLMARAGVACTWGRESTGQYGEMLAGIRLADKPLKGKPQDEAGKLLPGVSGRRDELQPGTADRKVQNFNFRLAITQNPDNQVPFPKPARYDPQQFALLADFLRQNAGTRFGDLVAHWEIAPGKHEANNHQNATISLGHFGGQFDYPDADDATRQRIYQDHVDYTQGLLWFLGHDPQVPEKLRAETLSWGLAKDEFTDNDHWPYYLYIREARRMVGCYVMTQKDIQSDRRKPDSIGLGSHFIDCHHVQRVAAGPGAFSNEGRLWVPGKVYEIPYRAITPEAGQCENLLVPVAASFSHVAFCAYRLEPTWMVAGHSAGVAAAIAVRSDRAVQEVEVSKLQERLLAAGQQLRLKAEDPGK